MSENSKSTNIKSEPSRNNNSSAAPSTQKNAPKSILKSANNSAEQMYNQQAHPLIKNQLKLDQNPKNLKELDQSLKARNKLQLTQLTLKKRTKIQLRKEINLINNVQHLQRRTIDEAERQIK